MEQMQKDEEVKCIIKTTNGKHHVWPAPVRIELSIAKLPLPQELLNDDPLTAAPSAMLWFVKGWRVAVIRHCCKSGGRLLSSWLCPWWCFHTRKSSRWLYWFCTPTQCHVSTSHTTVLQIHVSTSYDMWDMMRNTCSKQTSQTNNTPGKRRGLWFDQNEGSTVASSCQQCH